MTEHRSSDILTRIVGEWEDIIDREEVAEDYVRFRAVLAAAQADVYDRLIQSNPPPDNEVAGSSDAAHLPPLGPRDVPFDDRLLRELLDGVSSALAAGNGNRENLARLSRTADDDLRFLAKLARDTAFKPDENVLEPLAGESGTPVEAILFFGRVLAAPFVTVAVGRLKRQAGTPPKSSGICPWCGSPPGLARLVGTEGSRLLCCSLCGESWRHAQLDCPVCQDDKAQNRLWLDPDDPCFVQTCGNCQTYLKTVDQRKLPRGKAVIPLVWATATLHLDLIAEREGCHRAFPYAALR